MSDMANHGCEKPPQRPVNDGAMKGDMAHAGADAQPVALHAHSLQRLDAIDVDEVRRAGEAKGHDGHKTLPPGEDAAIFGRHFGQRFDRFLYCLRSMIAKGRGFHLCSASSDGRRVEQ
jgi:hypothetical protein